MNYVDTYAEGGIYDDLEYGSPYVSKGVKFARYICRDLKPPAKVLCLGCGNGWEMVEYMQRGHRVFGTELHQVKVPILNGRIVSALCPNLPFKDKTFDLLSCTEVLEHVPEDITNDFLKECQRVSKEQLFSIAETMDSFRTHINLHDAGWWLDRFNKNGLQVIHFQWKPCVELVIGRVSYMANYADGFLVKCR